MALNARIERPRVVVDNPDNVEALGVAAAKAGQALQVLVDIDPGIRRTGVSSPEAAVALAQKIAGLSSLSYLGVQYYCGRATAYREL